MKEVYQFTKVTYFGLNNTMKSALRKGAMKHDSKYFNPVKYTDRSSGEEHKYVGLAEEGMLCN